MIAKISTSVLCEDGKYRPESMEDCNKCPSGRETNAEKTECGGYRLNCYQRSVKVMY